MSKLIKLLLLGYAGVRIYRNVFLGGMPFWYDPARDLTLAGDMFQKFSFLGQPSGIPGFFYPPHWIWWLFTLLHVSPDPRVITFLAIALPYLFLFPLGLWLLRHRITQAGVVLILSVFILKYDNYFTQLWNLNLAPLILLWLIVAFDRKKIFFLGALSGLLLSVDFALGIPVLLTVGFFSWRHLVRLGLGFSLILLPTILFELKNQFGQTKLLLGSIGHTVVTVSGLTNIEILRQFTPGIVLGLLPVIIKKTSRFVWFLTALVLITIVVYIRNPNPIWSYHFTGLELIFLVLGTAIAKPLLEKFEKIIIACLAVFLIFKLAILIQTPDNIMNFDNLATRRQVVEFILSDQAKQSQICGFASFGRTAFERNYEYEYLLNLDSKNRHLLVPNVNSNTENCVYVAFPKVTNNELESYLNSVTQVGQWGTKWKKEFPSGLLLVFRERHERLL